MEVQVVGECVVPREPFLLAIVDHIEEVRIVVLPSLQLLTPFHDENVAVDKSGLLVRLRYDVYVLLQLLLIEALLQLIDVPLEGQVKGIENGYVLLLSVVLVFLQKLYQFLEQLILLLLDYELERVFWPELKWKRLRLGLSQYLAHFCLL